MPHVLIVTSSASERLALLELLQMEGFVAFGVSSSSEAVAVQAELCAEGILIDVNARDCTNLRFIQDLRRGAPHARIIAMTNAPECQLTETGDYCRTEAVLRAAGVNAVISKPITLSVLVELLQRSGLKRCQSGIREKSPVTAGHPRLQAKRGA